MAKTRQPSQPKILARSCQFCRQRKIRCDNQRPSCTSCVSQKRDCVYILEAPRQRPSTAIVNGLQREKRGLEDVLLRLKKASPEERIEILESIPVVDGNLMVQPTSPTPETVHSSTVSDSGGTKRPKREDSRDLQSEDDGDMNFSDEELDVLPFLSVDEGGKVNSFGPSSALQGPTKPIISTESPESDHVRNQLIANAILQRQKEHDLRYWKDIYGVPIEVALHLLDLHWNRQHHTFLLTYRPAIMRDLMQTRGPYCSEFLINAIFACASKYSQRIEVRDDPMDPASSGRRFFTRCDQLLAEQTLLNSSSIATLVGLLLLGSTYNALGENSKGWLYTGYGLRMIYDLGLHLDYKATTANAEDIEIRRRVFWGAFICDKLQSLYLGRPMTIHLRDAHVSRNFMDTMEEKELWSPYVDPSFVSDTVPVQHGSGTPIFSVTTFQQMCLLSRIMTRIINRIYVVGATAASARAGLQSIDDALDAWRNNLPHHLQFEPWNETLSATQPRSAPNVMALNVLYHSLIILLHRPFISDGHLRSAVVPASSWQRCSSAARSITRIALCYQSIYTLRSAPYILSYAVYVACTIHVRNAAATEMDHPGENSQLLSSSLKMLDELSRANTGVSRPASIIRKLMVTNGLQLTTEPVLDTRTPSSLDLDAILRMFPSRSPVPGGGGQINQLENFDSEFGLNSYAPEDLLYGFMDGQTGSFADFNDGVFRL